MESLRSARRKASLSQEELARRAGVSRAEVSAIETGRVAPSVATALALAAALGATVEDLFGRDEPPIAWAWEPPSVPTRAWVAKVGDRRLAYPCEPGWLGLETHDAVGSEAAALSSSGASDSLVIAGCDPAVALLRDALCTRGIRVIGLTRASAEALRLLQQGLVHVAGVHLGARGKPGNARSVRDALGSGYRLVRWAVWDEGLAFAPGARPRSIDPKHLRRLRWVGREPGSGARQCLDELFDSRPPATELVGRDHREVAQTIRLGAADAGICVRLVAQEAGLDFVEVRAKAYDLCFRAEWADTPAIRALVDALSAGTLRRVLGEVPGYETKTTGATAFVE